MAAGLDPGWQEDFDDEALEYLHDGGTEQLRETLDEKNQQDRLTIYLVSWTVTLVSAAGIFGQLKISDIDAISALSAIASASAVAVGAVAVAIFRPREWLRGTDPVWLSQYKGATKRLLMEEALDVLVLGFRQNREIVNQRDQLIRWLYGLTIATSLLIVAVQLVWAFTN